MSNGPKSILWFRSVIEVGVEGILYYRHACIVIIFVQFEMYMFSSIFHQSLPFSVPCQHILPILSKTQVVFSNSLLDDWILYRSMKQIR